MNAFTISWLVWAAAFAVIEGIALTNHVKGDTLSEHIWALFRVPRPGRPNPMPDGLTRLSRFLLLAGMAWLTVHLVTGGEF